MSRLENRRFQGLIVTAVCVLAALVACSTDSPTAPLQVPPPPTDGSGIGTGQDPFITNLSPASGPDSGGTKVTISGVGFFTPLRVLFDDVPGEVISVASSGSSIQVRTPRFTGAGSTDWETEECTLSDGTTGERYVPTPVTVDVELSTGDSGSLDNGFVYSPSNTSCMETSGAG